MNHINNKVDVFFDAYAARFNEALTGKPIDIDGTINSFSNCFIEANPSGIICGKNDETFRASIPKGYEFYKSIGTQSMHILAKETTVLDDFHSMVKIHWRSTYLKKGSNDTVIDFDVYYLVQAKDDKLKIFAYITGDEEKVLKEKGLIPNP